MNTIEVSSPHQILIPTPVRIPANPEYISEGDFCLKAIDGGPTFIAQADGDSIVAIVPKLAAAQVIRCEISPSTTPRQGVSVSEENSSLKLQLPQGEFGTYYFGPDVVRPYLWPVLGPGQVPVTRTVKPGAEEPDHKHHRSLFTAYEEANGSSNWNEEEGHGFTRHREFLKTEQGSVFGGFTAQGLWTNKDASPVLTETRSIRLYNMGDDQRLLDYSVSLAATHGTVEFGDTKEAGVLGLRVNPSMNGSAGGVITNSEGGRGEAECWGRRAAWCDYSGEVEGHTVGITVVDHPSNPNFPTRWHVRDYGLFATNPFSTASFDQGDASPYNLKNGEIVTFRYRVLIHQGHTEALKLKNVFGAFADFPAR